MSMRHCTRSMLAIVAAATASVSCPLRGRAIEAPAAAVRDAAKDGGSPAEWDTVAHAVHGTLDRRASRIDRGEAHATLAELRRKTFVPSAWHRGRSRA